MKRRYTTSSRLLDELYQRYGTSGQGPSRWRLNLSYWQKRYSYELVIGGAKLAKRLIDIAASLAALILLLPVFAFVAICIKLTDGGPVLYWQTRVGKWGREFPFPKFRSMVTNAEKLQQQLVSHHEDSVTFKMKNDPRITWIGRIIRKLSIDELPQFWCVLIGQMSLVGPRPSLPKEVALYTLSDRRRLDVIPGLTCIWQVSGRGDIPFPEQVKLDVQYIQSQNSWIDLKILFKTIPAVLLGKGAY